MNLAQMIEQNARLHPERPALSQGRLLYATYAQLCTRMRAISHYLRSVKKLPPGSRVGIAMTNCPEFWEVLFGAWHAGLVVVPVNPKLHQREIEFILAHSGASLCFTSPDMAPTVVPLSDDLLSLHEVIATNEVKYHHIKNAHVPNMKPWAVAPKDIAWIFYTSGTTGRPKGAMLSHHNLLMMIMAYYADIELVTPMDCVIHSASQAHGSGLWGLVHFAKAANNVIPESGGFDPVELADLLDHYGGLSMFVAPTMLNRLIASPAFVSANLNNLKTITCGGAPMYLPDTRRALSVIGPHLMQIYGQGESPMTITGLSKSAYNDTKHPRYLPRLGSVGVARTGVEVHIADHNSTLLPPGEVGEVVVQGDVVMNGYWYDDESTQKTLRNGWLHTGDIGSFDEDGFLTLLDRSMDMIISGGTNIYPREIEELLLIHPSIREVAVVGRPHPDWGEEVIAFVVASPDQPICEQDLDLLCLENFARFKRPRAYYFVDSLPKNSAGKVLKTELRQRTCTNGP
jgi:long-chain acyl-CoA synthetase